VIYGKNAFDWQRFPFAKPSHASQKGVACLPKAPCKVQEGIACLTSGLTDEIANSRWVNDHKNYSVFEIILYNMRHVQHHTAQLNLLLRQEINDAPRWVSVAKMEME
jgi:uncharacterized damage-inducible protein DinB